MTQIYTEQNLIQYYYKETDLFETLEIEDALENDYFLWETFLEVKENLDALPKLSYSPSASVVNRILAYSRVVEVG